jgi:hypothetical protein
MPDKDVFARNLAKGWRNVARCLHRGIDPKDAANRARLALQRNLKTLNGLPGCEELYSSLADSTISSPAVALKIFDKARSFERISDDRDWAGILTEAYRQTYIEMSNGRNHRYGRNKGSHAVKKNLAKIAIRNYLDCQLHGKVDMIERSSRDGGHWSDPSYRQAYFQELNPYLEIIAETLARDPSFTKPPTFPRYHRVRQTTEELMHTPLELMEG